MRVVQVIRPLSLHAVLQLCGHDDLLHMPGVGAIRPKCDPPVKRRIARGSGRFPPWRDVHISGADHAESGGRKRRPLLPSATHFFRRIPIFRATPITTRLSDFPFELIPLASSDGQSTSVRGELHPCSAAMVLSCLTSAFLSATA